MAGVLLTVAAIAALLFGIRKFALWIAHETPRPSPFEARLARKLREQSGCDWSDPFGDIAALPDDAKAISEVSIHARRISR